MNYVIAGLGNPGEEYAHTRHNTGRMMLEAIQKKFSFPDFKEDIKNKALTSSGKIATSKIILLEPDNFMNRSGQSVPAFVKGVASKLNTQKNTGKATKAASSKKLAYPNLIVIHDDLDLPLGKIKISYNRSAGGHRGVESVIKAVKSEEFIRIKVGISPVTSAGKMKKPTGTDVEPHIIGPFKKPELETIKKVGKHVADAVEMIITDSKEKAMGEFN